MDLKIFLFVVILCMLHTSEVESHEFLKGAYNSVKNAVVKGYHHVAHIFVNHDPMEDENYDDIEEEMKQEEYEQEITTTAPLETMIDIRFRPDNDEVNKEQSASSLSRRDAYDGKDDVPDLNTRFFINAPCGDGMRKSASGCRQVINN